MTEGDEIDGAADVATATGELTAVKTALGDAATDSVAGGDPAPGPAMTAAAPRTTTARIAAPAAIPLRRDRRDVLTRRL